VTDLEGTFTCDGRWIRDRNGRVRIFRGANVSGRSKLPPFLPFDDPSHLDRLVDWGFNIVRLLVIWEALEPERGALDQAYLQRYLDLVDACGARGLHVLVDFHQDLFSRELGGDGAPAWAVTEPGRKASGRTWFYDYFLNRGVRHSQAAFWADRDGIRTAFMQTVRKVMQRCRDRPAVIGYDLWNEPMSSLRQVATGRFERRALADFHRACIALRDEIDPHRLLFIEPTPLVAFGVPSFLPALRGRGLVFAPHVYDATAIVTGRYRRKVSTFLPALTTIRKTADRLGMPVLIGEFGALNGHADAEAMIEDQCRLLDKRFVSWTVWHYNPTDVDWHDEDASIVDPQGRDRSFTGRLVRPYPRAIAGTPVRWSSKRERPWTLEFRPDGEGTTEIVVPPRWRNGRIEPRVEGAAHEWDDEGRLLVVQPSRADRVEVALHVR
jgi:endoglycosylceramidase